MFSEPTLPIAADSGTAEGRSLARSLCYGVVWLTFASSSLVLIEPAPVDGLLAGLVLLLPIVGLTLISPALLTFLCIWLAIIAAQILAATQAVDVDRAMTHTGISLLLALVSFVIAAFVAQSPARHSRIVLGGWQVAAVLASLTAIAGYFAIVPGAEELFTLYERATGTFKDPNVLGPFLVVPVLYAFHHALTRGMLRSLPTLAIGVMSGFALFLTFSRGAWFITSLAVLIWGILTFTGGTARERRKLVVVCCAGIAATVAVIAFALQFDEVSRLLEVRASLSQDYDQGPDGRFGGQMKALELVAQNPFGIGSQTFTPYYHHEEAHNVYLSMGLNAGWLGGGLYFLINLLTVMIGLKGLRTSGSGRPYLVIALAAFTATALEGFIIDSDHWRHLYIEMAMVWGLATSSAGWQSSAVRSSHF